MDLIAKVEPKFTVSEDGIKVVLDVRHDEGVLDFLHGVGGMLCNVYVQTRAHQPSNETPAATDDGQRDMFAGSSEIPVDPAVTETYKFARDRGFVEHEVDEGKAWRRDTENGYVVIVPVPGCTTLDAPVRVGRFDVDDQQINEQDVEAHEPTLTLRAAIEKYGEPEAPEAASDEVTPAEEDVASEVPAEATS